MPISKSVWREKSGNRVAWGDGDAALGTLAVTLRYASLVPFGHASRRLSSGFARRRGRGADRPEAREHKGRARLARLARQRGGANGSHVGMLHAPAAASPITPVLLGTHPCYGTRSSHASVSRSRRRVGGVFAAKTARSLHRVNEHGMSKKTSLTWMDRPRD